MRPWHRLHRPWELRWRWASATENNAESAPAAENDAESSPTAEDNAESAPAAENDAETAPAAGGWQQAGRPTIVGDRRLAMCPPVHAVPQPLFIGRLLHVLCEQRVWLRQ